MLTHSAEVDWKGWRASRRNAVSSRFGDGEGEGRVALLVAGDQGVDAEHPAALVEQRPAAMAAGDVGGVEQGGDAVDRPHVGEDADRAGRRQRPDIVVGRAGGGEVDIAGIAERRDRAAVVDRPDIERDRRQRPLFELEQGEIARRIDRDDAGAVGLAPFRRDDPDRDHVLGGVGRDLDDMGVGDDPVGRDGEAAAMAEIDHLAVLEGDDDDAHHAAPRRRDVVGARRRRRREQGQEQEQESRQACLRSCGDSKIRLIWWLHGSEFSNLQPHE